MNKTILFDFDGTIAASVEAGVATFNGLAREYGFLEITTQNAESLRGKGPRAVMQELEIPLLRAPFVLRGLRNGIREALPTLQVADGIRAVVLALKEKGYQLGIVTSNSKQNVIEFLRKNQMECFDYFQAGSDIFGKAAAIKKMMLRENLDVDQTIFVGDEIRDIVAAQKNNMRVVGVTWGINSREGLERAKPDFVVESASELMKLLTQD